MNLSKYLGLKNKESWMQFLGEVYIDTVGFEIE